MSPETVNLLADLVVVWVFALIVAVPLWYWQDVLDDIKHRRECFDPENERYD